MVQAITRLFSLVREAHAHWYNDQTDRARHRLEEDVRRFGGQVSWEPVSLMQIANPPAMPIEAILADVNKHPKDGALVCYRGFVMTHAEAERHRAWDNLMALRATLRTRSSECAQTARLLQE